MSGRVRPEGLAKNTGIVGTGFLQARCPSCHPANSVKALKEHQTCKRRYKNRRFAMRQVEQ